MYIYMYVYIYTHMPVYTLGHTLKCMLKNLFRHPENDVHTWRDISKMHDYTRMESVPQKKT